MNKKILFTSGGTGGHLFPAINLMNDLFKKDFEVVLVTDIRGNNFLKENSKFRSIIIKAYTTTNQNLIKKFYSLILIFISILKAFFILKKEKPDLIIGFGGYVSFPMCFSSKFLKIPLAIYENNLVLGRTNKTLLPIAKKIFLGTKIPVVLSEKYKNKIFYVGNILREEIINFSENNISTNKKDFSILILGGSQGAEIFGEIIPPSIKMLKDKGYNIKINQQCTEIQKLYLRDFYSKNNIENNIFNFSNDVVKLMSSSDLAISRSGASTTAELVNTLTPFIAVPYPNSIDDHQYYNAQYYKNQGCCWVINQEKFTSENLYNFLVDIINNKKKLENIRISMKKNDSKDVYKRIYKLIKELI